MRSVKIILGIMSASLYLTLTSSSALAVTECTGKLLRVWTGDNGHVFLVFENGMDAYTTPSDPDTKNILAVSTAALITGKTITIRFQADSVPCDNTTHNRNDVIGVYLNK